MTKLKSKRNKSDYFDTTNDENKDFVAYTDRGGENSGGVTVLRKAKNDKERETFTRVNNKLFEEKMKKIDRDHTKRRIGLEKSGFLKHTIKGKQ